ncbi:unnamed protein product [Leuciscus chuanchicus]
MSNIPGRKRTENKHQGVNGCVDGHSSRRQVPLAGHIHASPSNVHLQRCEDKTVSTETDTNQLSSSSPCYHAAAILNRCEQDGGLTPVQPPGTHRLSFPDISKKFLGTVVQVFHFTTFSKNRFSQFRLCSLLDVQDSPRSASYSERQHVFTRQTTQKAIKVLMVVQESQVPNELFIGPKMDGAENYYTIGCEGDQHTI